MNILEVLKKILDDIQYLDYCKPKAYEVTETMRVEIQSYLEHLPLCMTLSISHAGTLIYGFYGVGEALVKIQKDALENSIPNCEDCPDRRKAHYYG